MAQDDDAKKPKDIKSAERVVDRAFTTGKVDRAYITRQAQLDAAEAVAMAGIAMESDEEADEATKLAIIANGLGNREKAKAARERERLARKKAKDDHKAATKSAKQAYEAIKFSDPNSLGFLRFVQVFFLLHIVFTLIGLLLTSRDTIVYDLSTIVDWIMVILEAVAFYFFWNRYKLARPLVIAIAGVGIAASALDMVITDNYSFGRLLHDCWFYIFLIFYFIFSDRVKATLVNDLSSDKGAEDDEELVIDRRGWPFYRNLIMYFFVFSVLGHWLEAAYCQLIRLGIAPGEFHPENTMLWRDWFYPFPMHGTAVVIIAVSLYPLLVWLKKRFTNRLIPYVISYFANVALVTVIEFVGGLMFNSKLENWDYTNMPFNFMGQVCLTNSLLFGVAASVIAWWVYPMLERSIARVRPATMNIVFVVVVIAGGILFSLYAIAPPEGIDLGQTSTQVAEMKIESERLDIKIESESVIDSLDDLRKEIEKSKYVSDEDRKDLLERVEKLTNESKELDEKVESLSASADKPADKTAQDQTSSTDQAATSEKSEETTSSEGEGQQSEEAPENDLAEAA